MNLMDLALDTKDIEWAKKIYRMTAVRPTPKKNEVNVKHENKYEEEKK